MALFEKVKSSKVMLDDTEALTSIIEATQNLQGHTEYIIKVYRGPVPENHWQVVRRYSDFAALHVCLQQSGIELPLPPKKVFGNMDREFIAERQHGLQNYLNSVLSNPMLASCLSIKRFLDPHNYSTNWQEIALQHVSMFFRSEPKWEVVEPLPEIGWRIRKHYFLIKPNDNPKCCHVLAWSDLGPDKFLPDKDLQSFMKLLPNIQHPYIYPTLFATSNENGALTIQEFIISGTLRDYICKTKCKLPFLKKYGKPKCYSTLQLVDIKLYGRQILEALQFLHEKGIPYGHLHAGNVILEGNVCKLLDIENHCIGLPTYLRPFIVQLKKIVTIEAINVYCFGHLLYEMAFGEPLNMPTSDNIPTACSVQVRSVLQAILTTEASKNPLPSVADLLSYPLFSDVHLNLLEKPQLKVSSKLKRVIKSAREEMEKRLEEEQKVIKQYKRLSKAQAHMMSEEGKKKSKKMSKKKLSDSTEEKVKNGSNSNSTLTATPAPILQLPNSTIPVPPPPPPVAVPTTFSPVPPPPPMVVPNAFSPVPPPPPPLVVNGVSSNTARSALLGSINSFNKSALKRSVTVDKSAPKI